MSTAAATAELERLFGVVQDDTGGVPAGVPRGILCTRDYKRFELQSDTGNVLVTFEGATKANRCLPGDHVWWSAEADRCELELRYEHPRLVGTLLLASKTQYGLTRRGVPLYLFAPYDTAYPTFIVGSAEKDRSTHRIAWITVDEWEATSAMPRGHLQQLMGRPGERDTEHRALLMQVSPWTYSDAEHAAVPSHPAAGSCGLAGHWYELLHGYTFHIDPAGCRDVDDVITFTPVGDDMAEWEVTISISDVAGWIEDGSPADIMASLIGQTVYDGEGRAVRPMLPRGCSEQACSLLPGKESYAIGLQIRFHRIHGIQDGSLRWKRVRLHTNASYTYEEFMTADTIYRDPLRALANALAHGPQGAGQDVGQLAAGDAHDWIEQLMLFYNMEAAKVLRQAGRGLLRRHSGAHPDRLAHVKQAVGNAADWMHLAYAAAEYCMADEEQVAHVGLGRSLYTHASSPIRRYADLVNQRILKEILFSAREDGLETAIVPVTPYHLNQRDKAIRQYERDRMFVDAFCGVSSAQACKAVIFEKKKTVHAMMKIRLYVPSWKRMISATYPLDAEADADADAKEEDIHHVRSRDGSRVIDVTLFREVDIVYGVDLMQRNWKSRVIFDIVS